MEIGQEIIIGRAGDQPLSIADNNVNPRHARLHKTGDNLYCIEELEPSNKISVFGMRIKRMTIKGDTPIELGSFKTDVNRLLQEIQVEDLESIWKLYDKKKRAWDLKSTIVSYVRYLPSLITMAAAYFMFDHDSSQLQRFMFTGGLTLAVLIISIILSDKMAAKKTVGMAELNADLKKRYLCPHCQTFLGFTPYQVLKNSIYCPNRQCRRPLP